MNDVKNYVVALVVFFLGSFAGFLVAWSVENTIARLKADFRNLGTKPGNDSLFRPDQIHINSFFKRKKPEGSDRRLPGLKGIVTVVLSGILACVLFEKFGCTPTFAVYLIFFLGLIAIFRVDAETMVIPDSISLTCLVLGFVVSVAGFLPGIDWKRSLMGIVVAAAILYFPGKIYEYTKGEQGLGGGDVKLLAMIGAFLSVEGVIFTLFFGALSGCVVSIPAILTKRSKTSDSVPFGPYLVSSAIIYTVVGKDLVRRFIELGPLLLF
jgi:prepilin signal peptidase PulO-like enzyme (type II secretory pathway)